MEDLMNIASYVYNRYYREFNTIIDEMKLHKLLYFAQRESLVENNTPLFSEDFYGWKFGPILKPIRTAYRENFFKKSIPIDVEKRIETIMNKIFEKYAGKDSWNLSRLTHGEYSWQQSRIGIPNGENGDVIMKLEDIRVDANRIRERRKMLSELGL